MSKTELELKSVLLNLAKEINSKVKGKKKPMLGSDASDYGKFVFSIDSFFRSTHFPEKMTYEDIGYKVVVASCSDVIAAGGKPSGINISMGVDKKTSPRKLRKIYLGIGEACQELGMYILKGDTKKAYELSITIACTGILYGKIVGRHAVEKGDLLYISDTVGKSAIGLIYMLNQTDILEEIKPEKSFLQECLDAFTRPRAKKTYGKLISKFATSSCDVSDGLFHSLMLLPKNGLGVELQKIPVDEELENLDINLLKKLLSIGEDYCYVFTIKEKMKNKMEEYAKKLGIRSLQIGKIVEEKELKINWQGQEYHIPLKEICGYDNFNSYI